MQGHIPRLRPGESALLLGTALFAAAPVLVLVLIAHGRTLDGGDGLFGSTDMLQYMAWIRESGEHILVGNRYDTVAAPRVFLHPMFALSGALFRLGVPVQLTLLAWLPAAAVCIAVGAARYARATVNGRGPGALAAIVALFAFSPIAALVNWSHVVSADIGLLYTIIAAEGWYAGALWGYFPSAIAVGLMPLLILGMEDLSRAGAGQQRGKITLVATGSCLVAWLHPWQGLILVGIGVGVAAWGRLQRRFLPLVPVGLAVCIPLVYYQVLPLSSPAWALASAPVQAPHLGPWMVTFLPLALLSIPGWFGTVDSDRERMLRLWPVAAATVYFLLHRSFFFHALEGLSLPLAVMSVRGLQRLRAPRMAMYALAVVLIVPGTVFAAQTWAGYVSRGEDLVSPGDVAALAAIQADSHSGPVVSTPRLGELVPVFTDHSTWLGHPTWSPGYVARADLLRRMFSGSLGKQETSDVLEKSGAQYALVPCGTPAAPVASELADRTTSKWKLGCAAVFVLDVGGR